MNRHTVSAFISLAIVFSISSNALRAQQGPARKKEATPTPTPRNSPAIDVKVETFRKQIIAGTTLGVVADITNNSGAAVYLRQQDVQLVVPAETERPGERGSATSGWFPTEDSTGEPHVISLKPNETYRVFWNKPPQETTGFSGVRSWFQFIRFTPGSYSITVETKYWDQKKFDGDDYHTAVQAKTVEFAAPESIILLGASLGGVIFTILAMVRANQNAPNDAPADGLKTTTAWRWGKMVVIVVGSILLSVMITILLSRISETQFFIKVNVSDFWGAIAVGFLANYGGWALLDKMIPGVGKQDTAKDQNQTKAKAAVVRANE